MKKSLLSGVLGFALVLAFFIAGIASVRAATLDLTDPETWEFYGRVFGEPGETGFLFGGMENDHIKKCRPAWWDGPAYNFAILKKAFRAPFDLKFRAQFFDTDVGFNAFYLACVDPANFRLPEDCQGDMIPGQVDMPFEFILGNAWNQPEDQVCVSLGTGHYDWTCQSEDGVSFAAGKFHDFEVKMSADNTVQVFVDGHLLKSTRVEPCPTGWYLLVLRSYDAQTDFINGTMEAQALVGPGEYGNETHETPGETGNETENVCAPGHPEGCGTPLECAAANGYWCNGTCQAEPCNGGDYQAGFEEGKRWCREHPRECGVHTYCHRPQSIDDVLNNACASHITTDSHGRLVLNIPCVVHQNRNYQVRLNIEVSPTGRVYLELPVDGIKPGLPEADEED